MIAEATASAKIILCGEHAVVYGQPAIAIPVPSLRATAQAFVSPNPASGLKISATDLKQEYLLTGLDQDVKGNPLLLAAQMYLIRLGIAIPDIHITLKSEIPVASGLGSGAAITTAFLRVLGTALGHPMSANTLNELVYEVEKIHHGTPSGVDNTVIVYERPIYFVRSRPLEWFALGTRYEFLIGDTGVGASTQVTVGAVRRMYETHHDEVHPVIESIGQVVLAMRQALESGDVASLGHLMLQNHKFLQKLTVSSEELDMLVEAALGAGAIGAKMSGGGRGGNMIALVSGKNIQKVREALINAGAVKVHQLTLG